MDSGSLRKAVMVPEAVKIRLLFVGWLSHGQSCHISYFHICIALPKVPIYSPDYVIFNVENRLILINTVQEFIQCSVLLYIAVDSTTNHFI